MVEEIIEEQPEGQQDTSDGGRLNVNEAMTPRAAGIASGDARPRWSEKFKANKFRILGGILGIVVFAGAVFGAYKFGQRQIQTTPQPSLTPEAVTTPTPDPTANWKTYTNTKYGYSIKYPEKWQEFEIKEGPEVGIRVDFAKSESLSDREYWIWIKMNSNPNGLSATQWVDKLLLQYSDQPALVAGIKREKDSVADTEAERVAGLPAMTEMVSVFVPKEKIMCEIVLQKGIGVLSSEAKDTFNLMLSTFKFLGEEKGKISFRVDRKGDRTAVVIIDESVQERVLREYQWPQSGPARRVYPSPNNKFLGISIGTAVQGALEIVNLENELTVATLSEYGKVIWLDDQRLVLNVPEEVSPPRPYEGGEGISLATFDAALNQYKVLKKADSNTDYVLEKVEDNKIFFEKKVVVDPNDWLNPTASKWRINFDGTGETRVE